MEIPRVRLSIEVAMIKNYIISNEISWRNFKELQKSIIKNPDIKVDKAVWKALRKGLLTCGYRSNLPNDMWIKLNK